MRSGAVQVINTPTTAVLADYYHAFTATQDSAAFIQRVSQRYTVATLERAAQSGSRECRRAAVVALGFLADQNSSRVLGLAMHDDDRGVRLLAEKAAPKIWRRSGYSEHDRQLAGIRRMITAREFDPAIEAASALIEQSPGFAEAWNQRALAYYGLDRYDNAIYDCHQTLEINPYHFGAAAGMGQCYLLCADYDEALRCFRRALKLNDHLDDVRTTIQFLEHNAVAEAERRAAPRKRKRRSGRRPRPNDSV